MKTEEFLAKLHNLDIQDDNIQDSDAVALIELSKRAAKPKCNFLELGSWKGKSAICLATVAVKENGYVWCVDHFQGNAGTRSQGTAVHFDVLTIFKQNATAVNAWQSVIRPLVAPIEDMAKLLPSNYFDFIFVDCDNRYESMKFVLKEYWKKLKNRGIMSGRNLLYDYKDKRKEVDEEIDNEYSHKHMLHPGIIKAVHEVFKGRYERMPNSTLWYKVKE